MKVISGFCIFLAFVTLSCTMKNKSSESIESEIFKVEKEFEKAVADKEIKEAFLEFAADSAVLNRNNSIIKGKEAIKKYFEDRPSGNFELKWTPDFIDVSESGDMAYTYGKYTFTTIDSTGNKNTSNGVFHTVWKKQADGNWKYVWD